MVSEAPQRWNFIVEKLKTPRKSGSKDQSWQLTQESPYKFTLHPFWGDRAGSIMTHILHSPYRRHSEPSAVKFSVTALTAGEFTPCPAVSWNAYEYILQTADNVPAHFLPGVWCSKFDFPTWTRWCLPLGFPHAHRQVTQLLAIRSHLSRLC